MTVFLKKQITHPPNPRHNFTTKAKSGSELGGDIIMEQIPKEISKQADRDIHQVALIKTNLALDYTGLCILLII